MDYHLRGPLTRKGLGEPTHDEAFDRAAVSGRALTKKEAVALDALMIGVETVKTHLSRICDKRGVRNRRALRRLTGRAE